MIYFLIGFLAVATLVVTAFFVRQIKENKKLEEEVDRLRTTISNVDIVGFKEKESGVYVHKVNVTVLNDGNISYTCRRKAKTDGQNKWTNLEVVPVLGLKEKEGN